VALNNSQYNEIIRTYEKKQLHTRDVLDQRTAEIYAKIPEYKRMKDQISTISVQAARHMLESDSFDLAESKAQIRMLGEQAKALLTAAGYPTDYLEPVYECADCKDTGYIGDEKCHCFKKAVVNMLYTQSNLQHILQLENFDTFSFAYYSQNHVDRKTGTTSIANITKAYHAAREFVDTFDTEFRNLFFYGDTGVGKTFLSNCIAKELIDRSYSVIYLSSFDLFDILAKSQFDKDPQAEQMNHHIFDCDLLIIDDLGTELANSFTVSQLFLCLNERLLHKKSTIISTNLSLESLVEVYSERTFSRITSNYTLLKLTGDDIRIKKKLMIREEN
jgi:DNA replication protein DnaC